MERHVRSWQFILIAVVLFDSVSHSQRLAQAEPPPAKEDLPTTVEGWHKRGVALTNEGKYPEALESLNKAIELGSKVAEVYKDRGNVYLQQKVYERALADYDKATELEPQNPKPFNNRGVVYEKTGKLDLAVKELSRAIELDPAFKIALRNRARIYQLLGQHTSAIVDLQTLRDVIKKSLGPDHSEVANALILLAVAHHGASDPKKADETFAEAVALGQKLFDAGTPEAAASLGNIGSDLRQKNRYVEADKFVVWSLELRRKLFGENDTNVAWALGEMALLRGDQNRLDEAAKLYQQSLDLRLKLQGDENADVAWTLGQLGSVFRRQSRFKQAEVFLTRCLELRRKLFGGDVEGNAWVLVELGKLRQDQSRPAEAAEFMNQSLAIRRKLFGEESEKVAFTLSVLGDAYRNARRFQEAEGVYKQSLAIRKRTLGEETFDVSTSLCDLGSLCNDREQYEQAEDFFRQALKIREQTLGPNHPGVAYCLYEVARVVSSRGREAEALKLSERALAIRRQAFGEKHTDVALSLDGVGNMLHRLGRYAEARERFEQALACYDEVNGREHRTTAYVLAELGITHHALQDFTRAEAAHLEALAIRRKLLGADHLETAWSLAALGDLHDTIGNYRQARKYLEESLSICVRVLGENHSLTANCLARLAGVSDGLGDAASAQAMYERAHKIRLTLYGEQHPDVASSLAALASMHTDRNDYDKAVELHKQALAIRKTLYGEEHPVVASSLHSLGLVAEKQGDLAAEVKYTEQALAIRRKFFKDENLSVAWSLHNLSVAHRRLGQYDQAIEEAVEALAIRKKLLSENHSDVAWANALIGYARLLKTGDYRAALPDFRASFETYVRFFDPLFGTLSEAEALLLAEGKQISRTELLSALRRVPGDHADEAYRAVWITRSRATRALEERHKVVRLNPEATALREDLRKVRKDLSTLALAAYHVERGTRLQELNRKKEDLERRLAALQTGDEKQRILQPQDLFRRLPANTAVVEILQTWDVRIAPGENDTRLTPVFDAFVISKEDIQEQPRVRWVPLGDSAPIIAAVKQWGESIRKGRGPTDAITSAIIAALPAAEVAEAPHMLRRLVWEKIEPNLNGVNTVIVVPDGALSAVPWSALPGKKPGSYLIEQYAIATAMHGQQVAVLLGDVAQATSREALVVGGVKYDERPTGESPETPKLAKRGPSRMWDGNSSWTFLQGTVAEAREIARLWPASAAPRLLTGLAASEAAICEAMPRARYVHLATHGFFTNPFGDVTQRGAGWDRVFENQEYGGNRSTLNYRNPLILCGVVLAGANVPQPTNEVGLPTGDDGILTGEEVVELDLSNNELLVLSACETGIGDVANGEGIFGLQRAFSMAGSRSVVASLWHVDDAATQALMTEFYRNLWEKKLGKLEALRQAQLTMLRTYDPKAGAIRGTVAKLKPLATPTVVTKAKTDDLRATPYYWAAFVLSGDWR